MTIALSYLAGLATGIGLMLAQAKLAEIILFGETVPEEDEVSETPKRA